MDTNDKIKLHSLKSVKWVALGLILPKLIIPIVTVLLAKILLPSDFGIISICSVFIGVINLIQGLGFSDFIIKEKEIEHTHLSTAFWLNMAVSLFVFGLMWITAPIVANIYHEPLIKKVLPILGLAVVFNGAGTIQWALLQKEMKFKQLFKIQVLPLLVSLCITLPLAYLGYGVWSLVAGEISKSFFVNIAYWLMGKWIPRFIFSIGTAKEMMKFGKWIITEKVQEYLYSNLDRIFLGYFGNLSVLGIYTIGRQIIFVLYNTINGPIGGIVFPMLSKIQAEIQKMRNGFFEVSKRVMLVNIPVTIAVAMLSFDAVPLLFSNKWQGLPLVLCIGVIGEGVARLIWAQRDMFKILNRPDVYPKSVLINLLFAIAFYPLGAMNGLIAFCLVRAFNDWLYAGIQLVLTSKIFGFEIIEFIKLLLPSLFTSLSMAIVTFLIITLFKFAGFTMTILPLIVITVLSIVLFIVFFKIFGKNDFGKIWNELKIIVGFS